MCCMQRTNVKMHDNASLQKKRPSVKRRSFFEQNSLKLHQQTKKDCLKETALTIFITCF